VTQRIWYYTHQLDPHAADVHGNIFHFSPTAALQYAAYGYFTRCRENMSIPSRRIKG